MERDDTFLDDKHVSLPPNWSIESMQSQQKFKQVLFFFFWNWQNDSKVYTEIE